MKQVSENPLAKQPVQKHRAGEEEQMETRILENSINKICRYRCLKVPGVPPVCQCVLSLCITSRRTAAL